jgi:hypothetical protein
LSRKVTVPVAADGEVVAVRVTLVNATGVMLDAVSVVVVAVACDATTTLRLLTVKLAAVAKNPVWVPVSRLEGMVPEAFCPAEEMVPVDPFRVTVRAAAGVPVQMLASTVLAPATLEPRMISPNEYVSA